VHLRGGTDEANRNYLCSFARNKSNFFHATGFRSQVGYMRTIDRALQYFCGSWSWATRCRMRCDPGPSHPALCGWGVPSSPTCVRGDALVLSRHGKVVPLHHRWLLPPAREPVFLTTPVPQFGTTAAGHTCPRGPRPRGLTACPACRTLTAVRTCTGCPPVAAGGSAVGRGAAPQLWTAPPPGGPKISRSGPARE